MASYLRRVVDQELDELLPQLPAILLDGPKGVGKTETALQRARTVVDLSHPGPRQIAQADPDAVLDGQPPVLLDEWHLAPSVFDAVKRAVDRDASGGRFILTGSAPTAGTSTHSGAGRITTIRMRPMTLPERGTTTPSVSLSELLLGDRPPVSGRSQLRLGDYTDLLLASGLPGLQALTGRALRSALDGYLTRMVDREMAEAGHTVRRPETLRAWLQAYAAATATDAAWEKIRDASTPGVADKPARATVTSYTQTLDSLRVLDEIPAWLPTRSRLKRLTRSPKHHLADPALAARLLGFDRGLLLAGEQEHPEIPRDGTLLGALFESLATLHVRVYAQAAEARVQHLRTQAGRHEVDLVVERGDGRIVAVEVKLAGTVDDGDVRHLRWLSDEVKDQLLDAVVLNTGPGAYRREDGIAVVPLGLLGP